MSERIQTVIEWIPVTERMPEHSNTVLILTKYGHTRSGHRRDHYGKIVYATVNGLVPDDIVTHWAPMPTFPTAKGGRP